MRRLFSRRQVRLFAIATVVAIGGVIYGYDVGVISGALLFIRNTIHLTLHQIEIVAAALFAGGVLGTLAAGPLADWLGRRVMIASASVTFALGVVLILIADSFAILFISRLIQGIGIGVISVAVPVYLSELVPKENRGRYVAFFQLFLTVGILLSFAVDLLFTSSGNWQAMFAISLIPAVIMILAVVRLPESPRWLVAQGHPEKARQVLCNLRTKPEAESELIVISDAMMQLDSGWHDLFAGKLLLPLVIGIIVSVFNQLTGINSFIEYAPRIIEQAGIGDNFSAMLSVFGIGLVNFIGTLVAVFLVDRVGRRPLIMFGIAGLVLAEVFLGIVTELQLNFYQTGVLAVIGLFLFMFFFAIGPGVVMWLAITELLPTRVRAKGVAVCLFFGYLAAQILSGFFLDLARWLTPGGLYWLCAGLSATFFALMYYLLPETKAKSLEDIQKYFIK